MRWDLATNDQLWTIIRTDAECPLPLMEGLFQEAVRRGMIKRLILATAKRVFHSIEFACKKLKMDVDDIVQLGYEGALRAIKNFTPGRGTFRHMLNMSVSASLINELERLEASKRQAELVSMDEPIGNGENGLEYYLNDNKTNVEKTVITKMRLEEKLQLLNEIQRDTFMRLFEGYNYEEIGKQMGVTKAAVFQRIKKAFILMTGKQVNLFELGVVEKASFK